MKTLMLKAMSGGDIVRNLGLRFRDYRMRLNMTRKEVSDASTVGMTTLYKFETGRMYDISFGTLLKLMRTIGLGENWDALIPDLPESPYLYFDYERKRQRIRHSTKKKE